MTAKTVAQQTEGVHIRLRLCLLRSSLVEDYTGPNKYEEDVKEILKEYAKFLSTTEGWEILEQAEKGVLGRHNHLPSSSSVNILLQGLDGWRLNQIRRDAALPHEPFMDMRIATSEAAEEDGSLAESASLFVKFMLRFSGESWTSGDLPRLHNEDEQVPDDAQVDQARVRKPSISTVLQRATAQDRPFLDTSSLTDWLLPEILLEYNDDDLGVAGTTLREGRSEKEGHFGVYALNQQPPPTPSPEEDPSERLWDPTTRLGSLSEEEIDMLRRRGMNAVETAGDGDDDDEDEEVAPGVRRAKGRDFVEYKGREVEDLVQDGKMPAGTAGSNEVGRGGERDLKQDLTSPLPAGGSSGAPAVADASKNKS